ncbi:MAG: dihydroxyacetone kinase subunit DhaL [Bacillota bacterium]
MVNYNIIKKSIYKMQKTIEDNKKFLTQLDSKIGDGDHGLNMNKGFKAVVKKIDTLETDQVQILLKNVAMALISNVGGASGPLYGTAFLKASSACKGDSLNEDDLVKVFKAGIDGVKMRGKAQKGEKTMLDSLIPAYETLSKELDNGSDLLISLEKAVKSANEGVEYTKTIIATKGRASYLGKRSIGHQDPGATSSYLLLKAFYETLKEEV